MLKNKREAKIVAVQMCSTCVSFENMQSVSNFYVWKYELSIYSEQLSNILAVCLLDLYWYIQYYLCPPLALKTALYQYGMT